MMYRNRNCRNLHSYVYLIECNLTIIRIPIEEGRYEYQESLYVCINLSPGSLWRPWKPSAGSGGPVLVGGGGELKTGIGGGAGEGRTDGTATV